MKFCKDCTYHNLETKIYPDHDMEGYPTGEDITKINHLCSSMLDPITGSIKRTYCSELNNNGDCKYYEEKNR